MKMKFVVEAEINNQDIFDKRTLKEDLMGELMKVKSGLYENAFYGTITSIELLPSVRKVQRA